MKRSSMVMIAAAMVLAAFLAWTPRAAAQRPEEIEKIRAASPDAPRVVPEQPRKLLIFSLCKGFAHSSVPYGARALEIMGEKTGAYTSVHSSDIAMFEPENLAQFDAVVFNNTTGELFLPQNLDELSEEEQREAREHDARLKASLLDFVRGGKGIVGIHAATDTFYDWPEYGEMMGGYFWGHPWNEEVAIKLDDPAHPINWAFKGQGFTIADEIYQFREPYSRENLRILLSLDTAKTDMTKDGIRRDDDDFAVSWVRSYGEGRVFYCSLGHRHEIFWTPEILQHFLDGTQWAMGDLDGPSTPSAQLPPDYPETALRAVQHEFIDDAIDAITSYELGDDPSDLRFIEQVVNDTFGNEDVRRALAEKLAAVLEDPDAGFYAKRFVCRQLHHLGTPNVVPAVAPLLSDPELSDVARYAIERMDAPEVDEAYLEALSKATGDVQIGLIHGLGERKSRPAIDVLCELVTDEDTDIACAAMLALGKIGGIRAARTLEGLENGLTVERMPTWADAYLLCADNLVAAGHAGQAQSIYESVYRSGLPDNFRVVALRGIVQVQGDDATVVVVEALRERNRAIREAAAAVARRVPGGAATHAFAGELPDLPPETQALLLISLAHRGDPGALPAVTSAARSDTELVRNAALEAMALLGDANSVALLTEIAASDEDQARGLARTALTRMPGQDINVALVYRMGNAPVPAYRAEAARALGSRLASRAAPALVEAASDEAPEVRGAALDALAAVAPPETFPGIIAVLVASQDSETRDAAQNAAIRVSQRAEDTAEPANVVAEAFGRTGTSVPARAALLRVLGQQGCETALPTVVNAAGARDPEVRGTALRVLSQWPNSAAMDDLLRLAKNASDDTERVIALRGFLRMIEMPSDRNVEQTLELYREADALAKTADETKLVLSGLGKMGHPAAMELIRPYLEDPAVRAEAELAAQAVRSAEYETSASARGNAAHNAIDGNPGTRWDTGGRQQPGQWFMLDLGWPETVARITLDTTGSPNDYPRGYEVYVSDDTDDWGDPVAVGEGTEPVTVIECNNARGRHIRIVQTGSTEVWFWSIHELTVETE